MIRDVVKYDYWYIYFILRLYLSGEFSSLLNTYWSF